MIISHNWNLQLNIYGERKAPVKESEWEREREREENQVGACETTMLRLRPTERWKRRKTEDVANNSANAALGLTDGGGFFTRLDGFRRLRPRWPEEVQCDL